MNAEACPDDELLSRVVHANASADERAKVERHVDGCASCAELVATIARSYFDADDMPRPSAPPPSTGDALAPGAMLGRYEIGPKIGAGGMGVVYAARDPVLQRPVALKVIARREGVEDERLLREARAMARVAHPNVVTVYDAGRAGEHVFVAMELVRGPSLRRWLAMNPSRPNEVLALFVDAGRGLAEAHEASVVHRDFKPDNVLVAPGAPPRARVTDFGLARPAHDANDAPVSEGRAAWLGQAVTRDTSVQGTPAYMSPEQLDGRDVGAASDQFSFAVALYEALWKKHPFAADTIGELRRNVARGPATPPSGDVPTGVWPVVARALAADPTKRWPSMRAFVAALEKSESTGAEWQLAIHVLLLLAMFFVHVGLIAFFVYALRTPDDGGESSMSETLVAVVAVAVFVAWTPLGLILTLVNAYGLSRRRRWAYVTTFVYAVTALFSCIGTPYGIFAIWSLTRPAVRVALGRR